MPKSKAMTGFGSKFALAADVSDIGEVASQWSEVIALKPPSDSTDTTEVTHFESSGRYREWIKTLIDGGEADIQVNLVPGSPTHLAMMEASASEDSYSYRFLIPKDKALGTFWQIDGDCLVTGFDPEVPLEDRMVATAHLKFTGARTEAAQAVTP